MPDSSSDNTAEMQDASARGSRTTATTMTTTAATTTATATATTPREQAGAEVEEKEASSSPKAARGSQLKRMMKSPSPRKKRAARPAAGPGAKYLKLSVRFIRNKLALLGLSTEGLKPQLIQRLVNAEEAKELLAHDPAVEKEKAEERKKAAEVAASAAKAARERIEKQRDYNERLATTDPLMQKIREDVKAMPTKLVRAELLNRGFGAKGKRKEVVGRLARILHSEKEEYEKSKTADEKREDELRLMRERIQLHQQVALHRKRALAKVGIMTKLRKSGFKAATARVAAALANNPRSREYSDALHGKSGSEPEKEMADLSPTNANLTKKSTGSVLGALSKNKMPRAKGKTNGDVPGDGAPAWHSKARRLVTLQTLRNSDGVCKPTTGDTVVFHYRAIITRDGTEIDNTYKRNIPESFVLGDGTALRCWEYALMQISVGETVRVSTPAEFAFGSAGCPPIVGSNASLEFEITLLRFQRPTQQELQKEEMEKAKLAAAKQGDASRGSGAREAVGFEEFSHLSDALYAEGAQ